MVYLTQHQYQLGFSLSPNMIHMLGDMWSYGFWSEEYGPSSRNLQDQIKNKPPKFSSFSPLSLSRGLPTISCLPSLRWAMCYLVLCCSNSLALISPTSLWCLTIRCSFVGRRLKKCIIEKAAFLLDIPPVMGENLFYWHLIFEKQSV